MRKAAPAQPQKPAARGASWRRRTRGEGSAAARAADVAHDPLAVRVPVGGAVLAGDVEPASYLRTRRASSRRASDRSGQAQAIDVLHPFRRKVSGRHGAASASKQPGSSSDLKDSDRLSRWFRTSGRDPQGATRKLGHCFDASLLRVHEREYGADGSDPRTRGLTELRDRVAQDICQADRVAFARVAVAQTCWRNIIQLRCANLFFRPQPESQRALSRRRGGVRKGDGTAGRAGRRDRCHADTQPYPRSERVTTTPQ